MIQLLGMQISLAYINYYISNLYILPIAVCVCRILQFVFVEYCSLCSSKRHTCFRRRKAGGLTEANRLLVPKGVEG
jgi:hypothetical protein